MYQNMYQNNKISISCTRNISTNCCKGDFEQQESERCVLVWPGQVMNDPCLFHKQTMQEGFRTAERWKIHMWCESNKPMSHSIAFSLEKCLGYMHHGNNWKKNVWLDKMVILLVNKKNWIQKPVQHQYVSCISRRNDTMLKCENILLLAFYIFAMEATVVLALENLEYVISLL